MMMLEPTEEQEAIVEAIDESSNCVVIARPGSGKTFTLAYAIRRILPELVHYKGIIAISYTNKASDELEARSLSGGMNRRSSFFGTIDKFYLTEIIIPFGRHLFGDPQNEIDVVKLDEVEPNGKMTSLVEDADRGKIDQELAEVMKQLYIEGRIVLETIGCLALYVFESSLACKRYLKARYSHVFIDEYQDCGRWQHVLFVRLVELGIQGVAVGDINQSIFAFAKKDSKYLTALSRDAERFKTYTLSKNHRSHASIISYSTRLLSPTYQPLPTDEVRVYAKCVAGSEIEIAHWLNEAVPCFADQFQVDRSKIGILARGRRTANLIHSNIDFSHKPIVTTPLDNDSSLWGSVFRKVLTWVFSTELTKYELVEGYLNIDLQPAMVRKVMAMLSDIEQVANVAPANLSQHMDLLIEVANLIFPQRKNGVAITNLGSTLSSELFLDSFIPPSIDQVQLMTLHKAKGLEFEVVFHLDLYRWIIPMYRGDYIQDLNLHYVGITRAKQCVILCSSTQRHSSQGIRDAEDSEFLHMHDLELLRAQCFI